VAIRITIQIDGYCVGITDHYLLLQFPQAINSLEHNAALARAAVV